MLLNDVGVGSFVIKLEEVEASEDQKPWIGMIET